MVMIGSWLVFGKRSLADDSAVWYIASVRHYYWETPARINDCDMHALLSYENPLPPLPMLVGDVNFVWASSNTKT